MIIIMSLHERHTAFLIRQLGRAHPLGMSKAKALVKCKAHGQIAIRKCTDNRIQ